MCAAIIFLTWCLYGVFSFTPLKWKDAFELNDNFKSYVALNPLQNFFTTLQFRKPSFDDAKAKEYFPVMADFLQLDSKNIANENYTREVLPDSKALESRPNVVLVICESFSMYKSSMSGNPLNTTPYFNIICATVVFFSTAVLVQLLELHGVFLLLLPAYRMCSFPNFLHATRKRSTSIPSLMILKIIINFIFSAAAVTSIILKGL